MHETTNDTEKDGFTQNTSTKNTNAHNDSDIDNFTDEFSNSLNYLQTLSKQKRVNDEKINFENKKRQRDLERNSTIKNYQSLQNAPYVNIELPEELNQPLIRVNADHFTPGTETMVLNPYKNDNVPYGVLKGGQKPTYRVWNKTQRNNVVTNPQSALTIQGINNNVNNIASARENRLHNLREKLKQKQLEETIQKSENIIMTQNLIQNPDYLARENMELVATFDNQPTSVVYNSSTIAELKRGTLRIRQRPGNKNALGRVKFMFPNKNDVYMHDTPSHALFSRARRDFSHGCVRVANPDQLAEFVLKSQLSKEAIGEAMQTQKTRRVILKKSVPVLFFYMTSFIDQNDNVAFYSDIYGYDIVLQEALAKSVDVPDQEIFAPAPVLTPVESIKPDVDLM